VRTGNGDTAFPSKKNARVPVPWRVQDVISFCFVLALYFLMGLQFRHASRYLAGRYLLIKPLFVYLLFDIVSIFICFYILKRMMTKYKDGWALLFRSSLNRKYLILSIVIGLLLGLFNSLFYSYRFPNTAAIPYERVTFYVLLLYGILIAPVTEEVWFRSFVFRGIRNKYGVLVGLIGSVLLFLLWHLSNFQALNVVIFGFVVTIFYETTDSLYGCMVIHATNNFVFLIFRQFYFVLFQ